MRIKCLFCGKEFVSFFERRRFCCKECRLRYYRKRNSYFYRRRLFRQRPDLLAFSLARLKAWKEAHKQKPAKTEKSEQTERVIDIIII